MLHTGTELMEKNREDERKRAALLQDYNDGKITYHDLSLDIVPLEIENRMSSVVDTIKHMELGESFYSDVIRSQVRETEEDGVFIDFVSYRVTVERIENSDLN